MICQLPACARSFTPRDPAQKFHSSPCRKRFWYEQEKNHGGLRLGRGRPRKDLQAVLKVLAWAEHQRPADLAAWGLAARRRAGPGPLYDRIAAGLP